jgi:hypothetical protein
MNFYSSSVALLWVTAFRVVAPPAGPRHSVSRIMPREAKARIRPGRQVVDGTSRTSRPG